MRRATRARLAAAAALLAALIAHAAAAQPSESQRSAIRGAV
jgi:hypothetical protein